MLTSDQLRAQAILSHAVETQAAEDEAHRETVAYLRSVSAGDPLVQERLKELLSAFALERAARAADLDILQHNFMDAVLGADANG